MAEWEEVEIEAVSDGLNATPSELHAAFEMSGDHLTEVRDRHTMMLVTSGELPETHMADIAPERRLDYQFLCMVQKWTTSTYPRANLKGTAF